MLPRSMIMISAPAMTAAFLCPWPVRGLPPAGARLRLVRRRRIRQRRGRSASVLLDRLPGLLVAPRQPGRSAMVDLTEQEQAAIRAALQPVAELMAEIGWTTRLNELTEAQVRALDRGRDRRLPRGHAPQPPGSRSGGAVLMDAPPSTSTTARSRRRFVDDGQRPASTRRSSPRAPPGRSATISAAAASATAAAGGCSTSTSRRRRTRAPSSPASRCASSPLGHVLEDLADRLAAQGRVRSARPQPARRAVRLLRRRRPGAGARRRRGRRRPERHGGAGALGVQVGQRQELARHRQARGGAPPSRSTPRRSRSTRPTSG